MSVASITRFRFALFGNGGFWNFNTTAGLLHLMSPDTGNGPSISYLSNTNELSQKRIPHASLHYLRHGQVSLAHNTLLFLGERRTGKRFEITTERPGTRVVRCSIWAGGWLQKLNEFRDGFERITMARSRRQNAMISPG